MTLMYTYLKFQEICEKEISLFKNYKKKSEFSN